MNTLVPETYPDLVEELYLSLEPKTLPPPAGFCPVEADVDALFADLERENFD